MRGDQPEGAGMVSMRTWKRAWIRGCGSRGRGRGLGLHSGVDGGAELGAESTGEDADWMGNDRELGGVGYAAFEEPQRQPRGDIPLATQERSAPDLELWASWAYK